MSRLLIYEPHYYVIGWEAEDGDMGAPVGQEHHENRTAAATAKRCQERADKLLAKPRTDASFDEFDYFSVEAAAANYMAEHPGFSCEYKPNVGGWAFESKRAAETLYRTLAAAQKAAKLRWNSKEGALMPEWAVQATAAGWKPPKGWKP